MDWNDHLKRIKQGKGIEEVEVVKEVQKPIPEYEEVKVEGAKKALDDSQELSNAGDSHRNPDSLGGNSPGSVSKPVEPNTQPDFPVITPLKFSTKGARMSTIKQSRGIMSCSVTIDVRPADQKKKKP